jgi:16S rRNA (cytosine1402-N4)-methyltransferase
VPVHIPVLVAEVLAGLAPQPGYRLIDATVGAGGHAAAILKATAPDGALLGLDIDPDALQIAHETLAVFGNRVQLVGASFSQLAAVAAARDFIPAQGVLLDLGLSSMQLANPARGFAFVSETLDMRMDPSAETTAADLVNRLEEVELADLLFRYGEEHASKRIARRIVEARPISSAKDLANVIERAVGRHGKTHPATRTFQALRIAVNQELNNLKLVLPQLAMVLASGGRAAIITFHSLEDRIVKRFFKNTSGWRMLNKHAIKPTYQEIRANPRARSAKLRVAERILRPE